MKLIDLSIHNFLNEVDSKSPAPGGGSVSALSSTLGCTLARMVAHLTFGKKSYRELSEDDCKNFDKAFNEIEDCRRYLEELIDKDTEAYNLVMEGYKLPKDTEEEKKIRKDVIETNLKLAIETPFQICKISLVTLKNLKHILEFGNKNAITDLGVAAILLYSGIEGGVLNVKVNLAGINDLEFKKDILIRIDQIVEEAKEIKDRTLEKVNKEILM